MEQEKKKLKRKIGGGFLRDKRRIKPFLEEIGKMWEEKCPDWRFGQLMVNVLGALPRDPFFPEEDEMLEHFKKYFKIGGKE